MEEARRLLDRCGIERTPVDLVRIARHLGIRRIRELDVRLDGQLVELGDGGYEVILSRHAPSHPSDASPWPTKSPTSSLPRGIRTP